MSSDVGDQVFGGLTEKGLNRQKGPQSVCKNNKLPKNSTSVKRAHFRKYRVPLGPPPPPKIWNSGAPGDRSLPEPPGFSSPGL